MSLFDGLLGNSDPSSTSSGGGLGSLFSDPSTLVALQLINNGMTRRPLTDPRGPFDGVPQMLMLASQLGDKSSSKDAMKTALISSGLDADTAAKVAGSPDAAKLLLQQRQLNMQNQADKNADAVLGGGGLGGLGGMGAPRPPTPGATGQGASISGDPSSFLPYYQQASAATGIPVPVLMAQNQQESQFNPNARGKAGEIGLTQIMPSTARDPGFGIEGVDPQSLWDPQKNIMFGAQYLAARGKAAGIKDWNDPAQVAKALTAYNGGGDPNYAQHVMRFLPGVSAILAKVGGQQQPAQVASADPNFVPGTPSASAGTEVNPNLQTPLLNNGQGLSQIPDSRVVPAAAAQQVASLPANPDKFDEDNPDQNSDIAKLPDGSVKVSASQQGLAWAAQNAAKYGLQADPQDPTHFVPAAASSGPSTAPASPVQTAQQQAPTFGPNTATGQYYQNRANQLMSIIGDSRVSDAKRKAAELQYQQVQKFLDPSQQPTEYRLWQTYQQNGGTLNFPDFLDRNQQGQTDTSDMKNYAAYVKDAQSRGQTPLSFLDYTQQMKRAGAANTVIDMKGEGAEAQKAGELAAQRRGDMLAAADAAPEKIARLQLLRDVLSKTQSGPLAGPLGTAAALANSLGISPDALRTMGIDPNQATNNEIAQKLAGELVTGSIGAKNGGFPASNFSVAERQFIEKMFPAIANQDGSNQAVSDVLIAREQRNIQKGDEWAAFKDAQRAAGKPASYEDFEDKFRREHAKDNIFQPIIDKFNNGGYANPGAGVPQPNDLAASQAPKVFTRQQFDALPSGSWYTNPDGQTVRKP